MIYIFNENHERFNLITVSGNSNLVDVYRKTNAPAPTLAVFHPTEDYREVCQMLIPFGFIPEQDKIIYFRDGRIIPALSTVGIGLLESFAEQK